MYANRFLLLVWYNKLGIVQCTYLRVSGYIFWKILYSFVWRVFIFTNSVDPDKMLHYAVWHHGIHCLYKYTDRLGISHIQMADTSCPKYVNQRRVIFYFHCSVLWVQLRNGFNFWNVHGIMNAKYSWFHEHSKYWIYCLYLHFIINI